MGSQARAPLSQGLRVMPGKPLRQAVAQFGGDQRLLLDQRPGCADERFSIDTRQASAEHAQGGSLDGHLSQRAQGQGDFGGDQMDGGAHQRQPYQRPLGDGGADGDGIEWLAGQAVPAGKRGSWSGTVDRHGRHQSFPRVSLICLLRPRSYCRGP